MFQFRKAQRKAVPMLVSVASVSGGGKTFSSLLLAAGIAGDKGRVAMIDTENGRGEMYTDSPGIKEVLPDGFEYARFDPPFSPDRYIEVLADAEKAGITVAVLDSGSHEWEGIGGCCEIAEKHPLGKMPNWSRAKIAHKKFVNQLLSTSMHVIVCLRAREKVKVFKKGDEMMLSAAEPGTVWPIAEKDSVVSLGLQPIAEKGFVYELLISLQLAESTHHAVPLKVPQPLVHLFPDRHLITKLDGERIRQWNEGAPAEDPNERLMKRARSAAEDGLVAYKSFFAGLSVAQKKVVEPHHATNKKLADEADRLAAESGEQDPMEKPAAKRTPPTVTSSARFHTWDVWSRDGSKAYDHLEIETGDRAGRFRWADGNYVPEVAK